MSKGTAKKILNIFGILQYIMAAFILLIGILVFSNSIPELSEELAKTITVNTEGIELYVAVGIFFILMAVFYFIEGWALRRAGKKEKTTLALVFTVLGLIGAIMGLFTTKQILSQIGTFAIEALLVYSVFTVRKESQK